MKRILFGAAISFVLATPALAQSYQDTGGSAVPAVVPIAPGLGPIFTTAHPGYVQGSFSASFSGFTPTPAYSQLTVGAASARVALPAGTVVIVYNTGANAAAVQLGSASVVATMANDIIQPGSWMAFTVGSATNLAAIETAGATALNISGGSGLPTGAGGGGGGSGGGGGAVTQSGTWTVQPGNTPNTVPWLVTGAGGTFPVTGTFWQATQPVSAASLPLPSGAATSALQTTGNTALTTINTTLGSPFQAGASIGNTGFGITGTLPAFAATPTFNLGTLNGAALAANQTNASQKTQIVDGSGNVIASTSNNLDVQCANCSSSGVSTTDNATWTAGSSLFAGSGGEYSSSLPTPIANGHQALAAITQYRALWNDWYNSSGTEMGTAASPVLVGAGTSTVFGSLTDTACAAYNTASCSGPQLLRLIAELAGNGTGVFGAATLSSGVAIGGSDGTDLRAISTDASGNVNVHPTTPVGAASLATGQVSVAATATSIATARTGAPGTGRASITLVNTTTTAIYIGGSGVTTTTGQLLPGVVGASLTLNTTAAIYGIVATGTATVTELETF